MALVRTREGPRDLDSEQKQAWRWLGSAQGLGVIGNCNYLWPQPSDIETHTFLALDTVELSADLW